MNSGPHPGSEQLQRYAFGLSAAAEDGQIEAHLPQCSECLSTVLAQQSELVRVVEALPSPGPLPALRPVPAAPVQAQHTASGQPRSWPLVASLSLLAAAGLAWGGQQTAARQRLEAQQQLVSGWLARADVRPLTLTDLKRRPSGRVLLAVDVQKNGQGLFVLPDAPSGLEYRAWVARDWHRGEPMTLASRSRSGVFKVALGQNDYLCLSLDRPDASTKGPQHILGKLFY